ncbi:hypothetical protein HYQ45_018956 [Verticillium longisporum]|uniref:Chromo domain-containing protein n=1 Tax=Verticillium longisporum TaxID=100787 RepID=A0A8I2ZFJ6_VERLO|nr:hypothetical protein HYQ45_018956 [Verticillium longisporum]
MVRGELAVAISSTYRAYHPGRRRLAPITLLPKHDTTAYIYDEYKTLPNSKDSRVHINYLVGWTDLQAGMISVDAGRIHEYVSARAYEDWNTKRATERDEELRKEEEAENVKLVEEAEMKERGMNLRNGTFQVPARSTSRDHAESSTALKDKRRKASRHIHQRASPVSRDSAPTILAPTESSRDMKADGRPDSACDTDASIRRQLEGDDTTGESESLTYSPPAISTVSMMGFTPLGGRRSSPWTRMINSPSVTNYQSSVRLPINSKPIVMESPAASSAEPTTKDSKKATLKPPVPPAEPEDESGEVYEVKRLEDTKLHDTENGVQRMFLVRWKGSWPEGQNPTWEPEENIPQDLARKFMLKRKAEIGKNKATDTARRTASPPWKQQRKWSSVSEAFAGDDNGPDFGKTGKIKSKVREAMGPDGDEQLLVVDEQTPTSKPALNWDMLMGSKFGGTA